MFHPALHHIFPKSWCRNQGILPEIFDSIINKTPLSYRTNRIIGGDAPSRYILKLETGSEEALPIAPQNIDISLKSHLIDPAVLRADNFEAFMRDRQLQLLDLIEQAIGQRVYRGEDYEELQDAESDPETAEAELTMTVA